MFEPSNLLEIIAWELHKQDCADSASEARLSHTVNPVEYYSNPFTTPGSQRQVDGLLARAQKIHDAILLKIPLNNKELLQESLDVLQYMLDESDHKECDFPEICPNEKAKIVIDYAKTLGYNINKVK